MNRSVPASRRVLQRSKLRAGLRSKGSVRVSRPALQRLTLPVASRSPAALVVSMQPAAVLSLARLLLWSAQVMVPVSLQQLAAAWLPVLVRARLREQALAQALFV